MTVPVNSQVVNFSVVAPSAELAADGANAWANAYLDRRAEQAAEVLDAATSDLRKRYNETETDVG